MSKILVVVKRELVARVRTKAFIISTLLLPLMMGFFAVAPALLMSGDRTQRIVIVDGSSDGFGEKIRGLLAAQQFEEKGEKVSRYALELIPAQGRVDAIRDSVVAVTGFARQERPDSPDGVLVLTDDVLVTGKAQYFGGNVGSVGTMGQLEGSLSRALSGTRMERAGLDPKLVMQVMARADLSTIKVSEGKATGESGAASFALAYGMGFILYLGILLYGQQTAGSVIEEKGSRIMEVLASSLTPFQMMLGKILGVGLTGLLQLGIWGGSFYLVSSQRPLLAKLFGLDPVAMQGLPIPGMPGDLLLIFLLYFGLGFLVYGALFAAVGSMVNSLQESQQAAFPVTMMAVLGFFGTFAVIKDPNAGMGVVMSFIPFFAPFVMPVRWSMAAVPVGQLLLSLASMVLGLLVVTWIAGRIYRTGILMYGKKPTIRELMRWIRA